MSAQGAGAAFEARARITDGAIRSIVRLGVADASMSAIASEAGVSKALLHYHFADRAQLLAHVIGVLAQRLVQREQAALAHRSANEATVVDALWHLVARELNHGELRAVLELGTLQEPALADATEQARRERQGAAVQTVGQVLALLDLTPRVPVEVIAGATVAFVDGLAIGGVRGEHAQPSFDVFWLAILSLCD